MLNVERKTVEVKQLIEKYLANETSKEEERRLRQLLLAVPKGERSKQDEALLLMLAPMHSEPIGDIFDVDYSEEYHTIVRRRKMLRLRYAVLATLAVAASVVLIVLFNWNRETTPTEQPKQTEVIVQQLPTERESNPQIVSNGIPSPTILEGEEAKSSHREEDKRGILEEEDNDPHFAWARSLIDNYHEDEVFSKSIAMKDKEHPLKEGIEIPTPEAGTEWAANDIHKDMATIKAKGERLRKRIEEMQN